MKNEILIFLFLIRYIITEIPKYTLIKRREKITFNLDDKTSSFYAFLNFEQDYEEDDHNEYSLYYFLKLNKKIGMKCKIIDYFPDESEFNKTSKEDRDYPLPNLGIEEENTQLAGYEKFKKGMENQLITYVFYIKEEYYNAFDKNENLFIERINNTFYVNESTYEIRLDPGEIKLIKGTLDDYIHYFKQVIFFVNSPFSELYINYTTIEKNTLTFIGSNLFLYNFFYENY